MKIVTASPYTAAESESILWDEGVVPEPARIHATTRALEAERRAHAASRVDLESLRELLRAAREERDRAEVALESEKAKAKGDGR